MKFVIDSLSEYFISQNRTEIDQHGPKESFWATESETPLFDLYHKFIGTPFTNPMNVERLNIFTSGKKIEEVYVDALDKMGILLDKQVRIDMEREGIRVTGYMDAMLKPDGGIPFEVKTYYGDYQEMELDKGKYRSSYAKQLRIYMDFANKSRGILFYVNRATGKLHEFEISRDEIDITPVYQRWAKLHKEHIVPKIEPKSEFRYKIPVQEVDWKAISTRERNKVLRGEKVIGDSWEVAYSPYKNLIIEREGSTLGYSDEEIQYIKSKI